MQPAHIWICGILLVVVAGLITSLFIRPSKEACRLMIDELARERDKEIGKVRDDYGQTIENLKRGL